MSEQQPNENEETPTTSLNYFGMNTGEQDQTTVRMSFSIRFQNPSFVTA